MTGAPVVIKLGGRALEGEGAVAQLAKDLAPLAGRAVVVHGGGGEVTAWCERLGIAARFEGGRRVTDAQALEVATAVLAGLVNKRMVAQLRGTRFPVREWKLCATSLARCEIRQLFIR